MIFIIVKRLYYLFALLKLLKECNYVCESLDPPEYIIENKSMRNIKDSYAPNSLVTSNDAL